MFVTNFILCNLWLSSFVCSIENITQRGPTMSFEDVTAPCITTSNSKTQASLGFSVDIHTSWWIDLVHTDGAYSFLWYCALRETEKFYLFNLSYNFIFCLFLYISLNPICTVKSLHFVFLQCFIIILIAYSSSING